MHKVVLCLPESWSNWNLEMLVFKERGKPEYLEKLKPLGAKEENQQQTQPTYGASSLTTAPALAPQE